MGKGNIAVVAPPGPYSNMVHPEDPAVFGGHQGYNPAPPSYTSGSQYESEDGVFSDDAVQKGEPNEATITRVFRSDLSALTSKDRWNERMGAGLVDVVQ